MAGLLARLRSRKGGKVPFCSAVVAAAGSATRMEGVDKILTPLGDLPLLAHTLRPLEESHLIREIVVVTREDLIVPVGQMCREFAFEKVRKVVVGGENRTQSVFQGLRETDPMAELIAIHDGARPFLTREVLEEVVKRAAQCGAAVPGVPVKDTIKRVCQGIVAETLEREYLCTIQTPQVFEAGLIRAALHKALEEGLSLTDDAAAVEQLGMKVALTAGDEENIKVTTPLDLLVGEEILSRRGEL